MLNYIKICRSYDKKLNDNKLFSDSLSKSLSINNDMAKTFAKVNTSFAAPSVAIDPMSSELTQQIVNSSKALSDVTKTLKVGNLMSRDTSGKIHT